MSVVKKLRKGFNINLVGKAENKVEAGATPSTYAVKPTDFVGFSKPKLLVKEGDAVKAGTPIYYDKSMESVMHSAPVSGKVKAIVRGEKRKLLEIVIEPDATIKYEEYKQHSTSEITGLSKEEIVENLQKSGVWPYIVQRPYAVVANPTETPKAIYISGFDSSPLAPDMKVLLEGETDNFKAGIDILKKLASGSVHLNINAEEEIPPIYSGAKGIQINKFSGPHPAGNVGVQIHHIDPIGKGDLVWTVSPFGVVMIGRLFTQGKFDASKVIAVVGSEIKAPKYYKTICGANVKAFIDGNLNSPAEDVRIISGNVLTGEQVQPDGYLGFYDNMITAIPEGREGKFMGSFEPTKERLSFHRSIGLFSFLNKKNKEYVVNTNINGEHRAFVQSGTFEQVVPMDLLPTYLLKAIMAEDFEEMEALGIYEVAEEDLALCEFIDVSKHEVQSIVREGLELMRNS